MREGFVSPAGGDVQSDRQPMADRAGAAPAAGGTAKATNGANRTSGSTPRADLQRSAPANLRGHLARAVTRVAVLLVADLSAFYVLRALYRLVTDAALLGPRVAAAAAQLFPADPYLDGWQFGLALILGLVVTGNYGQGDRRRDPTRLGAACALATALPLWGAIFNHAFELVLAQYLLISAVVWLAVLTERMAIEWTVKASGWARGSERAILVGRRRECDLVRVALGAAFSDEMADLGFVDVAPAPDPGTLGSLDDLAAIVSRDRIATIVLCGLVNDETFETIADAARVGGCRLLSVPRLWQAEHLQPSFVWVHGQPLVELTSPSLKGQQLFWKRLLDLFGAAVGLVVLSPLFAVIAALIKLESRGPVFFVQDRVGGGGRLFRIVKFRTMASDADGQREGLQAQSLYGDGRLFKIEHDPRLTRIGGYLRRLSLDELPQLVNVLLGDMSLVGPRPPMVPEVALYDEHHYARFDVKPGITGPWQVSGRNQITDFEQVVALETEYIRTWSIAADLLLLLRTIPAVLRMRGAY